MRFLRLAFEQQVATFGQNSLIKHEIKLLKYTSNGNFFIPLYLIIRLLLGDGHICSFASEYLKPIA